MEFNFEIVDSRYILLIYSNSIKKAKQRLLQREKPLNHTEF